MNIFTIATAISIIALGYFVVPKLRRALMLRKHGVPSLPKRALPPRLPRMVDDEGDVALEMARRRRYEAMGISEEFDRRNLW
ncbi:hypothetical protein [Rhodanobacter denitrificans]|uniref:hypothetical protein n=1 Tax=Rhodanobacter denitrificans TaxID=666685 RepID=UPI001F194C75|nr:hypothetical protein [Rhodanobacter denitrificans]UJJ60582.1 hypothetical protein LRK55_19300 [Rhodanobacter denitrificans]